MKHLVAPSILSADFLNLGREILMINESEADIIHVDVMDGVFVPNISIGFPVIKSVKKIAKKPLDVHLMISNPDNYVERFVEAGADYLSVHIEASVHLNRTINKIKSLNIKAGVALNPHTPVALLEDIITYVDFVCLMSVNPGFGGQQFIDNTLNKIQKLKELIKKTGSKAMIEVDGGVTVENSKILVEKGVDILVAGNTVFGSSDAIKVISSLKKI